jgi:hypothetical protein
MSMMSERNLATAKLSPKYMQELRSKLIAFVGPYHRLVGVLDTDNQKRNASFPVFSLGLSDLVSRGKDSLKHARQSGWRFVAGGPKGTDTAGGCHYGHAKGQPKVLATLEGATVAKFLDDIDTLNEKARQNPAEPNEQYLVTILRIPALHLESFWLKGKDQDLVAPYGLIVDGGRVRLCGTYLDKLRLYSVDEFCREVLPAAQETLGSYQEHVTQKMNMSSAAMETLWRGSSSC